jgi:hypothetical protein
MAYLALKRQGHRPRAGDRGTHDLSLMELVAFIRDPDCLAELLRRLDLWDL